MAAPRCPRCGTGTEDFGPEPPVRWVSRWSEEPSTPPPGAETRERESPGAGGSGRRERRHCYVLDRYCPACETVMPSSACLPL